MRFRFVDRITAYRPREFIAGLKTVSFEEYQLRTPFGLPPALPESLLLESLFQLGNWLIILSTDFRAMGVPVRVDRVEFLRPLLPGEVLRIRVNAVSFRDDGVLFDGSCSVGDELAVRGTGCVAAQAPLAEYDDPDDLRVLCGEIFPQG